MNDILFLNLLHRRFRALFRAAFSFSKKADQVRNLYLNSEQNDRYPVSAHCRCLRESPTCMLSREIKLQYFPTFNNKNVLD